MFTINSVASTASTTNGMGAKQQNAEKHRRHVPQTATHPKCRLWI
jgi:hypothetical protein